jgi:uncharacterized protein YkwD
MTEARAWVLGIAVTGLLLVACDDKGETGSYANHGTSGAGGTDAATSVNPGNAVAGTAVAGAAVSQAGTVSVPPVGVGMGGSAAPAASAGAPAVTPPSPPVSSGTTMPAAGSGAMPMAVNPPTCTAAPANTPDQTVAALAAVNTYRVPAGSGCATMIPEINASAAAHCAYYAMYTMSDMCISNPHLEVQGCAGFTGATPGDRMKAAGFMSNGGSEVMAFVNNAQGSVDTWVNSVWHRVPILDPWTTQLGYGSAARCDTIDFARGTPTATTSTVVVYPYDGQTNLPLSFNGANEGPTPPMPSTGWPSSTPISVYAQKAMITEHVLTKDGDATPIDHVWLDAQATIVAEDMRRQLTNVVFMYGNLPFEANTKYRVKISGTYAGGALMKEWTFTTGAAPVRGGRPRM